MFRNLLYLVPTLAMAQMLCCQQSAAVFHVPQAVLDFDMPPFQRLFDFDGDGDLDAVGTRIYSTGLAAEVAVWENVQGAFQLVYRAPVLGVGGMSTPPANLAVETGDFDHDGKDDFVVSGGGTVLYISQPGATFATTQIPMAGFPRAHALAAGDMDGDGIDDFAVAVQVFGGIQVVLHGSVAGVVTTTLPLQFGTPWMTTSNLFDGPTQELLVTERDTFGAAGVMAIVLQYSGGQLVQRVTLTSYMPLGMPAMWMCGDLDQDGDQDIVLFRKNSSGAGAWYQIFRCTAPNTFTRENYQTGGPAEYLADVDGDGDLDGVCCGSGGTPSWPNLGFDSTFEMAINGGGGAFALAWQFPGAGSMSLAGARDIDADGDLDLVAGRCVFYGEGPWLEPPLLTPPAGGDPFTWLVPSMIDDFDHDGDIDIPSKPALFGVNRGDGRMTAGIGIPPGYSFHVDLDGDGARDVLYMGLFGVTQLYHSNGAGQYFLDPTPYPVSFNTSPAWSFARDLDGDGDEELIIYASARSWVYWNDQGLLHGPATTLDAPLGPVVGVADFNGDGHLDLLQPDALHVQLGTGNPAAPFTEVSFTSTVPLTGVEQACNAIADVNDDGRPDALMVTHASSTSPVAGAVQPVLLINTTPPNGPLSFQTVVLPFYVVAQTPSPVTNWSSFSAGDFDGDGKTDLAIGRIREASQGYYNLGAVLLRRSGDGQVLSIADYEVRRQLINGHAADIDGDGDTDLVGTHVFANRRFRGAAAGRRIQELTGTVGEGGSRPLFGSAEPFRAGVVEQFLLSGIPGPTVGLLGYSNAPTFQPNFPLPGVNLLIDPTAADTLLWFMPGSGQGRGAGRASMSIPLPAGLFGFTFYSQAFVLDAAAPAGSTSSNRIVQTMGQ